MAWKLNPERQIWLQLVDVLKFRIVSGQYPAGVEAAVGAGAGRRGRCQSEHHAARARCAGGERARQRPAEHRALCHTG